MASKSNWAEANEIAYNAGYRDAIEDCIRVVHEKLGDRLVNNTWMPGSPLETEMLGALQQRRPR